MWEIGIGVKLEPTFTSAILVTAPLFPTTIVMATRTSGRPIRPTEKVQQASQSAGQKSKVTPLPRSIVSFNYHAHQITRT